MPEGNREWKLPKNVRQYGDAGGDRKIYIEDYVITFLEENAKQGDAKRGILLGEVRERDGCPYLFVDGAAELDSFAPNSQEREEIRERIEKYFGGRMVLGWFLTARETPFVLTREIAETFQKNFASENQILLVRDTEEKENFVFVMDGEAVAELPGYYIYYEKNASMQEYMISRNAGKSVETEKPVRDDAIKKFRRIIREKNAREKNARERDVREDEAREKKKLPLLLPAGRAAYLAGGFLTVTVLALGVTMVYNYDKMRSVEKSLARLTDHVDSQSTYLEGDADTAQVMLHLDDGLVLQDEEKTAGADEGTAQTESGGTVQDASADAASGAQDQTQDAQSAAAGTFDEDDGASDEADEASGGADGISDGSGAVSDGADGISDGSGAVSNTAGSGLDDSGAAQGQEQQKKDVPVSAVARASYTVKMGDTLAGISQMYYGDLGRIAEICELNGIEDENTILPGQKILLP